MPFKSIPALLTAALLLASGSLAATPAQARDYLVATWNLEWMTSRCECLPRGGEGLCEIRDGRQQRAQDWAGLKAIAQGMNADIVAFQEVDGAETAANVFDPAVYDVVSTQEDDVQRTGFAIRKGIRWTQEPDLVELDTKPRKGCGPSLRRGAVVTVDFDGKPTTLVSLHLKSGCFSSVEDASDREGAKQACADAHPQHTILADWVSRQQKGGVPFILLGDFNRRLDQPGDRLMEMLKAAGPGTVAKAADDIQASCDPRYKELIDHIVLDADIKGWMVPGSHKEIMMPRERERLTDHCPVVVTLRP